MSTLNTLSDIKRILRTIEEKIKISTEGPGDAANSNMSDADAEAFILEIENLVLAKISPYYDITATLTSSALAIIKFISGRLACYAIYSAIFQAGHSEKEPDGVTAWKIDATAELKELISNARNGIHLTGFTLKTSESALVPVRYNLPISVFKEKGIEGICIDERESETEGIVRDSDILENV